MGTAFVGLVGRSVFLLNSTALLFIGDGRRRQTGNSPQRKQQPSDVGGHGTEFESRMKGLSGILLTMLDCNGIG